jgi:hypothetical protein
MPKETVTTKFVFLGFATFILGLWLGFSGYVIHGLVFTIGAITEERDHPLTHIKNFCWYMWQLPSQEGKGPPRFCFLHYDNGESRGN